MENQVSRNSWPPQFECKTIAQHNSIKKQKICREHTKVASTLPTAFHRQEATTQSAVEAEKLNSILCTDKFNNSSQLRHYETLNGSLLFRKVFYLLPKQLSVMQLKPLTPTASEVDFKSIEQEKNVILVLLFKLNFVHLTTLKAFCRI